MTLDVCKCTIIQEDKVENVKSKLEEMDFSDLLLLSKCFGDLSRIKILYALETHKEMCVCDLSAVLDTSNATTSHHLRFLKKHGMTKSRKDGKIVYYSLTNGEMVSAMRTFLNVSGNVAIKS